MTTADHLLECLHSRPCERAVRGTGDLHVIADGRCDNCDDPCICPALRACTARVLGGARAAVLAYADLVDAVGGYSWDEAIAGSLAAIDRLSQEAP